MSRQHWRAITRTRRSRLYMAAAILAVGITTGCGSAASQSPHKNVATPSDSPVVTTRASTATHTAIEPIKHHRAAPVAPRRTTPPPTTVAPTRTTAAYTPPPPPPPPKTTPAPPPPPRKTTPPPPPRTTTPPPPPAQPACHPLTNGGNCYEPGEFCRASDHGATGVAGDGKAIECEDNNGWRWEPI